MLHELEQPQENFLVGYFYCEFTQNAEQTALRIMRTLLFQLVNRLPPEHPIVRELQARQRRSDGIDLDGCCNCIVTIASSIAPRAIRFLGDGLDELEETERNGLLRRFSTLSQEPNIYCLFFCRYSVKSTIAKLFPSQAVAFADLASEQNVQDIRRFLEQKLSMFLVVKDLRKFFMPIHRL
jgi:hypothetical protein